MKKVTAPKMELKPGAEGWFEIRADSREVLHNIKVKPESNKLTIFDVTSGMEYLLAYQTEYKAPSFNALKWDLDIRIGFLIRVKLRNDSDTVIPTEVEFWFK